LESELQQTTNEALEIRKKLTESETKLDVIKSQAKDKEDRAHLLEMQTDQIIGEKLGAIKDYIDYL
jgi:hypothetical protein